MLKLTTSTQLTSERKWPGPGRPFMTRSRPAIQTGRRVAAGGSTLNTTAETQAPSIRPMVIITLWATTSRPRIATGADSAT